MPDVNGFIDIYFEEYILPNDLTAGEMVILTKNGFKLSDSSIKKFVPVVSISVLNKSTEEIKIIVGETENKSFRVPAKSSRSFDKYPCWDISVRNEGSLSVSKDEVFITLINDLEGVSRYNAYAKMKGRTS